MIQYLLVAVAVKQVMGRFGEKMQAQDSSVIHGRMKKICVVLVQIIQF